MPFKKGHKLGFKKGYTPWNRGKTMSLETCLKMSKSKIGNKNSVGNKNALGHIGLVEEKNPAWKGTKAGYQALHQWIRHKLGRPFKCEICKSENKKKYEWASKSHKYLRQKDDWMRVCTSCHRKYDIENNDYNIGFLQLNAEFY